MKQAIYTRAEFIDRMKDMLKEMEADHEEHTGITAFEAGTFLFWVGELTSLEENS